MNQVAPRGTVLPVLNNGSHKKLISPSTDHVINLEPTETLPLQLPSWNSDESLDRVTYHQPLSARPSLAPKRNNILDDDISHHITASRQSSAPNTTFLRQWDQVRTEVLPGIESLPHLTTRVGSVPEVEDHDKIPTSRTSSSVGGGKRRRVDGEGTVILTYNNRERDVEKLR